jgi:hypothetical protein
MMTKATLSELLKNGLQYDSSWGIYALGTGPDSPARIGQMQFDQGGILDGKSLVLDGVRLGDAVRSYTDGDDEMDINGSEFLAWLIDEDWIEFDNPECYQDEPGCPECHGAMYGADFPNGDGHGTCLLCGHEAAWDNDEGEWKAAQ